MIGLSMECISWLSQQKTDVKFEVTEYKEKRSLSANAYFYVLVDKIAKERTKVTGRAVSSDDIHREMILKYGTWEREADGSPKWVVFPKDKPLPTSGYFWDMNADVTIKGEKSGEEVGHAYIVVRGSHTYNSKEMSELINGTVSEAQDLGIETRTSIEIEQMIKDMESHEKR